MNSIETIFLPIDSKSKSTENHTDEWKIPSGDCVAERIGEIFRLSKNTYSFVCVHCSQEFRYFSEFTIHIENHFDIILRNVKDGTSEVMADDDSKHTTLKSEEDEDEGLESGKLELILSIPEHKYTETYTNVNEENVELPVRLNIKPNAENEYSCPKCDRKFKDAKILNRHMFTHLNTKPFQCNICLKRFAQKRYVLDHIRLRHKEPNEPDEYKSIRSKKRRKATEMVERTYECYLCHKPFKIRQTFYAHFRTHVENPLLCLTCGVRCSNKYSLQRHMLHHMPKTTTLKCDDCGKTFTMRRYLLTHIREKHPPVNHGVTNDALNNLPLPEICTICNKSFTNKSYFRQHMKKHTTAKSYKCHICGWEFHERGNLNRHIDAHTGAKPYYCKICNKSFAIRYGKDHQKIHTGEKKHQCTVCGFRFISASALHRHSVRHTQIKKYQCDQCPNAYARSDKLLDHKRKHSGEMKHVCSICGKGYVEKRSWKKHMYSHEATAVAAKSQAEVGRSESEEEKK